MPEAPLRSMDSIGEGATALMYACQQGREREVRAILAKKPTAAEERDRTRKTALHYCAENATPACADAVLRASPGLMDAADEDGYTPLHLAVIAGNGALVRHLLAAGADVDCRDLEQHSVVHWATVCGEVEALDIVLAAGARVSSPDVHGGYPVHYAAQMCGPNSEMGNDVRFGLAVLRRLLQAPGVDVNVRDRDGRQPILWAASAGSADAILALVNAGANVEAEDKDGLTALHCAASRGHTDCLETLLTLCGAEVDVIDSHGCTALFYAATLGHADATRLLLSHGADPNRQDRKGRTPVHCGAAKGQLETLRLLAAHGASLWLRNVRGDLPLHDAVASGRTELVRWLIKQRPDSVDAPNNDGRCPLHVAAIHNNVEMCKVILDQQALLNPVMRSGRGAMLTPLDAALHRGNRGCAKYLQLHGGVPASRLTDKTARLRGATQRVETPTELRFMTPDVQPSRTGMSLANSPLQLGTELSRSESRTLQVRVSDDVAIRRVERLDPCKHHAQRSDSSGDDSRAPRRRRQRRSRHDSDYSSEVSDAEADKSRHRRDRRGSASDASRRRRSRHADDDAPRRRHRPRPRSSSPTSHSSASEEATRRKKSVLQVEKEPRKRASRKQSSEEEQTSEYSGDESDVQVTKETVQKHRKEEVTKTKTVKRTEQSSTTDKERRKQKVVKKVTGTEKQDGNPNDKSTKRLEDKSDSKKKQVSSKQEQKAKDTKKLTQSTKTSKHQKENVAENMLSKSTSEDTEKTEDTQTSSSTTVAREILKAVSTERTVSAEDEEESLTGKNESAANNAVEDPSLVSDAVNGEVSAVEKESQPQRSDSFNTTSVDEGSTHQVVTADVHHEAGDEYDEVASSAQQKTEHTAAQENGEEVREAVVSTADERRGEEVALNDTVETESKCASSHTRDENIESVPTPQTANELVPIPSATEEKTQTVAGNEEHAITGELTEKREQSQEAIGDTRDDETTGKIEKTENIKEYTAQEDSRETAHPVSEADSAEVRSNVEDEGKGSQDPTNNSHRSDSERSDSKAEEESFEQPSGDEGDSDNEGSVASSNSGKSKDEEDTSTRSPSSALPDSGFEPSPRRDQPGQDSQLRPGRISRPCRENADERPPVNTVSVTQAVQNSMRKYHLERRIFQQLLELKRLQIRAGRANEQVLVKRLVDDYRRAGLTVGLKGYEGSYTFRAFEKYLYDQLRTLQSAERRLIPRLKSSDDLEKLSAVLRRARFNNTLPPEDPALCTHGTHRCHHAAHAYTGIPCAAYIAKPNHHTQPKGTFLPRLVPRRKPVTLELDPGGRHVIALPTERMGRAGDKRYYVSFTIKGGADRRSGPQEPVPGHRHAKSL